MKTVKPLLYFFIALVCSFLSCFPSLAESGQDICVKDKSGETVCVKKVPERIVSLAPSLTELVFDLNAGSRLVGRTSRCNFPEEAARVLEIGPYMAPDFEKLLTVKPDLVLAPKNGMRPELVYRIKSLGIPVYVDDSGSIEDINQLIMNLGVLLNKNVDAVNLVTQIEIRRKKLADVISELEKASVLFVVGINPLVVAGSTSFLSSMLSEAGGRNVVNELSSPYPKFSMEEVMRQNPDVIFMLDKECHGVDCLNYWKNFQFLKAVKNKRVYEVNSDLMSRPGARTIEALEALANHLHPGASMAELSLMVNETHPVRQAN